MTAAGTQDNRDVVPRWRPFGITVRSGETAPLGKPDRSYAVQADLSEVEDAFRRWPGLHTAADLVGAALSSRTPARPALDAARYLLRDRRSAGRNPSAIAAALIALADGTEPPVTDLDSPEIDFGAVKQRARDLRRIVRAEPRNAVRWADLALAHTVLGHPAQAEREIRTALALAGPNRFLLRAAARLYVHLDRPDAAHDLLVRDPAVLDDPWLAAAELATASLAGTGSRHLRRARLLLDDANGHAPHHLAELASQVATAELRAGRARHAKRLMALALREPTDNALAQAEWASANGLNLDRASLDLPRTYEARALRSSHEGDWAAASAAGLDWLADQPFASEPAQFTSYAASIGAQDWALAETAARAGLVANPDHYMLRNNLAFALANQNDPTQAADELKHIDVHALDTKERAVVAATSGIVLFRAGAIQRGRDAYQKAIEALGRDDRHANLAALATVFWAREEVLSRTGHARAAVAVAADRATASRAPEAQLWAGRLQDLVSTSARDQMALPTQRPGHPGSPA